MLYISTGWKKNNCKNTKTNHSNQLPQISCLIPFRNEETNLASLISALEKQKYPKNNVEFIFINDHSEDDSIQVIRSSIKNITNVKIIHNDKTGKKEAILTGVKNAGFEYIVTIDADCIPNEKWLHSIGSFICMHHPDMVIAPIMIKQNQSFHKFFQGIDFLSLVTTSACAAGINKPILCNGANLAFTKNAYLESQNALRLEYLSGDDVFLLHAFKKQGRKISFLQNKNALIYTSPLNSIKEFLNQRSRWASKSTGYTDVFTIYIAWMVLLTNIFLALLPILFLLQPNLLFTCIIFSIIKFSTDYYILQLGAPFFNFKLPCIKTALSLIIYPYYIIILVTRAIFGSAKWKGRKL